MHSNRAAQRALRLASHPPPHQHVCLVCRTHAARQFSTSASRTAGLPFLRQIKETLFGTKETRETEARREKKSSEKKTPEKKTSAPASSVEEIEIGSRKYKIAARVDPDVQKDYVPASKDNKLQRLGSVEWVKRRADKGEKYAGFVTRQPNRDLDRRQWEALLHHITVEVLTLQKAGRDVEQILLPRIAGRRNWHHTRTAVIESAIMGDDAAVHVLHASPEAEQAVLNAIPMTGVKSPGESQHTLEEEKLQSTVPHDFEQYTFISDEDGVPAQKATPTTSATDADATSTIIDPWTQTELTDLKVKLAIITRATQLTGKRLRDPVISRSQTIADLLSGFLTKPKPQNLASQPQLRRLSANLPNVVLHETRRSPVHREKAIGRWKLVEEELQRRELPVKAKTRKWPGTKIFMDRGGKGRLYI